MKTRRHHFTVPCDGKMLAAYVPDEGGKDAALERLRADDPLWSREGVEYRGMIDWFERIKFDLQGEPGLIARKTLGIGGEIGDAA